MSTFRSDQADALLRRNAQQSSNQSASKEETEGGRCDTLVYDYSAEKVAILPCGYRCDIVGPASMNVDSPGHLRELSW